VGKREGDKMRDDPKNCSIKTEYVGNKRQLPLFPQSENKPPQVDLTGKGVF
jgi:hypothetical protein